MSPETEKQILQKLDELKQRQIQLATMLDERQHRCQSHSERIDDCQDRISALEKQMSGLRAWIASAGLVGGIIGWIGNAIFGRG